MKKIPIRKLSLFEKLSRFRFGVVHAIMFYLFRYLKQKSNLFYLKYIARFGFSKIGSNVTIDGIPKFLFPCSNIILMNRVRIGSSCVFQGTENSEIFIDENVSINDGCFITSLFKVKIGKNTSIGEYTSIRDYNHNYSDKGNIKIQGYVGKEIIIGENCWIGRGCIILPGVKIGDDSIIAANSVVNKNVKPHSIYGGVPAKFIKFRYFHEQ